MDALPKDDLCPEKPYPWKCPSLTGLLALLDRIPALVWETDTECSFTSLSGAGLRHAGVAAADYLGRDVESLFPATDLRQGSRLAHRRALEGEGCSFDTELNGRDLRAYLEPLRDEEGIILGVIGVALDLTGRLVAERALRLSEQSYRSLIEEAPYAICRCTLSGQLLQVNRSMLGMLGYDASTEGELLERDLPGVFAEGSFAAFRVGLLSGNAPQEFECAWRRRDGQDIQVQVTGRVILDQKGVVSHLDVIAEDVTEKKELQAQLHQAQKMQAIGQLAGGVAHDFNNLLMVIGGHVDLMLRRPLTGDFREQLEEVREASERAVALTRQLLAFSRRQVLQSRIVDLNQVIQNQIGMLSRLINENVKLVFLPGSGLGCVRADPNQIEQVLMNLVVNAQDAMPRGGMVTIETANAWVDGGPHRQSEELKPGDYVQLRVRDTGHGMDRETQARIFEPFFTTKKAGQGTGLGLSTVYGIVRQSSGHIRVESQPEEGATFTVYLPCVGEQAPLLEQAVSKPSPPRGSETILLAEDESSISRLVKSYLEDLGYRVLSAPDGAAAMEIAQSYPGKIDLLLSDFVMPRMGGRELAAALKKMAPHLKVMFMSGYPGHEVDTKELDNPDAHVLSKPVSMELLATTVRKVLNERPR